MARIDFHFTQNWDIFISSNDPSQKFKKVTRRSLASSIGQLKHRVKIYSRILFIGSGPGDVNSHFLQKYDNKLEMALRKKPAEVLRNSDPDLITPGAAFEVRFGSTEKTDPAEPAHSAYSAHSARSANSGQSYGSSCDHRISSRDSLKNQF